MVENIFQTALLASLLGTCFISMIKSSELSSDTVKIIVVSVWAVSFVTFIASSLCLIWAN